MKFTGNLESVSFNLEGGLIVAFKVNEKEQALQFVNDLKRDKLLTLDVKYFRKMRSKHANALLWECLGQMATALQTDKWEVYLLMLQRYGQYIYLSVGKDQLPRLKQAFRELQIVGEVGDSVEVIAYIGSSNYDTQEFSYLLDGVISEMKELGLTIPLPEEIEKSLQLWQKHIEQRR